MPAGSAPGDGCGLGLGEGSFDAAKLRPVARAVDAAPLSVELRDFLSRAADYTLTPLPMMLRMAMRAPDLGKPPAERKIIHRAGPPPSRMTEARQAVLRVLDDHGGAVSRSELASMAGVGASVVKGLVASGTLVEVSAPRDMPYPKLDPDLPGKALAPDQAEAALAAARGGRPRRLWHHASARGDRLG